MKPSALAISLLALVSSTTSVMAFSSSSGPTGNGTLPNADVIGLGKMEIAQDIRSIHAEPEVVNSSDQTRILYGAAKNLEVGVSFGSTKMKYFWDNIKQNVWGVNVKRSFDENKYFKPAVGFTYSHSHWEYNQDPNIPVDQDDTDRMFTAYGVISKSFDIAPEKVKLTSSAGFEYLSSRQWGAGQIWNRDYTDFYLIADFAFANGATLSAEHIFIDANYADSSSALVLHYPLTQNCYLKMATIHIPDLHQEHQPIFGLDYTFNK